MKGDLAIIVGVVCAVAVGVVLLHYFDPPKHHNGPKIAQVDVSSHLSVMRVPVYGKYVTCVRYSEAIDTGAAGGLSCDWVGYHAHG